MCTVTLVRTGGLVRLACNRDELRSRPAALSPRIREYGQRRAVLPVDPISEGTWVAVNDAGVVLTLLNVNPRIKSRRTKFPQRSRGTIIPSLLHCDTLSEALSEAIALNPASFAPFRLVLADCDELAEMHSDGERISLVCRKRSTEPSLFTSSGLGDHLVEEPRLRLFCEFFNRSNDLFQQQVLFHQHQWPDSPELSVRMSREEARTVSLTVVSLGADVGSLTYRPDSPDQPAKTDSASIPILAGVVA